MNLMQRLYFDAIESGHCTRAQLTKEELALVNDEINLTDVLKGVVVNKDEIKQVLLDTDDAEESAYLEGVLDGIEYAAGELSEQELMDTLKVIKGQ
jgi:hypothetical protein